MTESLKTITVSRDELTKEIVAREKAEETLKHYTAELKRSNEELQQFAYIASHDLQEPLRMISSYLQLLERRYKNRLDKDADEFIAFAVDGAKRLQDMINGLLSYSRMGKQGRPFEAVNGEAVLGNAITNLKMTIDENQAVITNNSLPVLMGDESQITQLFQNLIANAIKYRSTEPPHIRILALPACEFRVSGLKLMPEIEKHLSEIRSGWIFSFRDNGVGIDPQYRDRIFNIFQRLHGREYPGIGIGLSICRRIVERHGGRIWVESEAGKGATFYFTLPEKEAA
jgi:light-regulated signal transduction histidine kinase (bacteriophytochrome)